MWRDVLFWAAAAACLVAQVGILRSTVKPYAPAPEHDRVPRPRTAVEVAWVLLPAVVLLGIFALTWTAMHQPPVAPAVQVSATPAARASGAEPQ